jgi:hypothetical protein
MVAKTREAVDYERLKTEAQPEKLGFWRSLQRGRLNTVTDGDYAGYAVALVLGEPHILTGGLKSFPLNRSNVASCTLVGQDARKNQTKATAWGALGLTQGVGWGVAAYMLGGNYEVFDIAVDFKDGKRSLLRVNRKIALAISNMGGV